MRRLLLVYIMSITSFSAYALNGYGYLSGARNSKGYYKSKPSSKQKPKITDITQEVIRKNIKVFFFAQPILVVEIKNEKNTIFSSLGASVKSNLSDSAFSYKSLLTMFREVTKNTNQKLEFVQDSAMPHIKLRAFSKDKQSIHLFVLTKKRVLYEIRVEGTNLSTNEIDKYLEANLDSIRSSMADTADSFLHY